MHGALQREGLESKRLSNDVENVIRPLLGVGWPTEQ
jgi:hypothetical protein